MKGSKDKTAQAGPVELGEKALDDVAGGYELRNVVITSYQLSAGADDPAQVVGAGFGGGPHVKVFNG